MGVVADFEMSASCCYRYIIHADKVRSLGLESFLNNSALEYWGGFGIEKVVMTPCSNGEVIACYCFYPASKNDLQENGWNISATPQQLVETFPTLDSKMKTLMLNADDIKMWRRKYSSLSHAHDIFFPFFFELKILMRHLRPIVYNNKPYQYWVKGKACLLGDAGKLLHQSMFQKRARKES